MKHMIWTFSCFATGPSSASGCASTLPPLSPHSLDTAPTRQRFSLHSDSRREQTCPQNYQ